MVSKEMRARGAVVKEIEAAEYGALAGRLREIVPRHIPIEIERVEKVGKKLVRIWSRHPKIVERALEKAKKAKLWEL